MATQAVTTGTRHVLRDVTVLGAALALTAGAVSVLSIVVGQWA